MSKELQHLRGQMNAIQKKQWTDSSPREEGDDEERHGEEEEAEDETLSFEERQAIAFEKEQEAADNLLAKTLYSEPMNSDRSRDLAERAGGPLEKVGAYLAEVTCSESLCQSVIEYPEESEPSTLQQLVQRDMCPGGCWIRRLADREKWEVYSARAGEELPAMGAIPTR